MSKKLKVLGLAIVAVCAFGVVSAGAAQAAPHWTVGTSNPFTGEKSLKETVTLTKRESAESAPTVELTIPSLGIKLNGTGLKAVGGKIKETSKGEATKLSFTGVTVTSAAGCTVSDKTTGTVGTVNTTALSASLATVGTGVDALFTPKSGTEFTNVVIGKAEGKTCAVTGEYPVTGTAALKVDVGTMNTTLHGESSQAIQEASGQSLKFKGAAAYLDLNGDLELTTGETWGVNTTP